MKKSILAIVLASSVSLGACATNSRTAGDIAEGAAYGAAGSLIVLLMWIYFSSAVLLLGASCARALEEYVAKGRGGAGVPASPQPTGSP